MQNGRYSHGLVMANPESDVTGGHKAMLVVYIETPSSTRAVAGIESVYALEGGSSLKDLQFIKKDSVIDTADKAYSHFLANRTVVAKHLQLGGSKIHIPPARLNSKDSWETRYRIHPGKSAKYGFPKGGEKNKDNGSPLITAIREFKEEIGVDVSPDVVTGHKLINKVHVYFANVTDVVHDSLRKEIDAAYKTYTEKSELFDPEWLDVGNTDPDDMNAVSKQVRGYLLDPTKITPIDPKEISAAKSVSAPAHGPPKYIPPHFREKNGGQIPRQTDQNKPGTKKRHTGGRGRKTRRSP